MKKIILILSIIIISSTSMFASDELALAEFVIENATGLSKDIQNRKYPAYRDLKLDIETLDSTTDLTQFYKENKVPILWPTLQNLVIGFGSGSKSQGNPIGGRIYQITDSIIVIGGLSVATFLFVIDLLTLRALSSSEENIYGDILKLTLLAGAASHAIQTLDTLIYGSVYNLRLKNDLKVLAKINPIEKEISLGAKILIS